jgi:hypothetical protein
VIASVTRETVLEAMRQCDALGRDRFRAVHGFGRATSYEVTYRRRRYDSKAIVGVAAGLELGEAPSAGEFSGGAEHAARRLVLLGFRVLRDGQPLEPADVAIPTRLSASRLLPELRLYVCRPTGARAVEACRRHGFGAMLSPLADGRTGLADMSTYTSAPEGMPYVLDNGAWSAHQAGQPWPEAPLLRLLDRVSRLERGPEWVVLPDIVGAGLASLYKSKRWHDAHGGLASRWLLAVQDGMSVSQVARTLDDHGLAGIFVGGTTRWKWESLPDWAALGLDKRLLVHVGRVNSLHRAQLCRDIGVSSIDGSSVSRFAVNASKMARPCDGDGGPVEAPRRVALARSMIAALRGQQSLFGL